MEYWSWDTEKFIANIYIYIYIMNKIWDPSTNKFVLVNSEIGKNTLKQYIRTYVNNQSGGAVIDVLQALGLIAPAAPNIEKAKKAYRRAYGTEKGIVLSHDKNHAICNKTGLLLTKKQYDAVMAKEKIPNLISSEITAQIGQGGFSMKDSEEYEENEL